MEKNNVKDIVNKMVKELNTHPDIIISELNDGNQIDENEAVYLKADVADLFNEINEDDEDLFYVPDQTEFRWESKKKNESISGECSFTNFAIALNANFLQPNPAVHTINYERYRYFDGHPFSGDGWLTLYEIGKSITTSKLFLFNNDKLYPLVIDLRTYIEMLYVSKGFYFWQFLFLEDSHKKMVTEIFDDLSISILALKNLLPGTDTSVLEDRLNSFKI